MGSLASSLSYSLERLHGGTSVHPPFLAVLRGLARHILLLRSRETSRPLEHRWTSRAKKALLKHRLRRAKEALLKHRLRTLRPHRLRRQAVEHCLWILAVEPHAVERHRHWRQAMSTTLLLQEMACRLQRKHRPPPPPSSVTAVLHPPTRTPGRPALRSSPLSPVPRPRLCSCSCNLKRLELTLEPLLATSCLMPDA